MYNQDQGFSSEPLSNYWNLYAYLQNERGYDCDLAEQEAAELELILARQGKSFSYAA